MTKILFIVTFFMSLFCTNAVAQDMIVDKRNIELDIREFIHPYSQVRVSKYVKYKGLYFIALKERIMGEVALEYDHIVVYSPSDGKFELVYKPNDLRLDGDKSKRKFYVRNDSLIVGKAYDENRYLCIEQDKIHPWDNDSVWMVKDAVTPSNVIFEDKDFTIKRTDIGEWGRYLSFVEKGKKHTEHLYRTDAIHIFRMADGYYLPMRYSMGHIANPCEGKVQSINGLLRDYPSSKPEIIFDIADGRDEMWSDEKPDTVYSHFFLSNGKIHALAMTSGETNVVVFENNRFVHKQSLGKLPLNEQNTLVDVHDNTITLISIDCKTDTPPVNDSINIEPCIRFFAERGIGITTMLDAVKALYNDGSVTNNHPTASYDNANLSRLIFMNYALPKFSMFTNYQYYAASGIIKGVLLGILTTPTSLGGEIPDYKEFKTVNGKKARSYYITPVPIPEEDKQVVSARIKEKMTQLLGEPTQQTSNSWVWILPNGVRFRFDIDRLRIWIDNEKHPVSAI